MLSVPAKEFLMSVNILAKKTRNERFDLYLRCSFRFRSGLVDLFFVFFCILTLLVYLLQETSTNVF